ncbi:hypothetical protein PR202_gb19724 [Eleusine coracana subsp. coracana]|uniref:Uncharacterized protein n=1 Tax=Eleusine coracana subsp. coracana TaxID=191504 RepID=A0AAV5FAR5_ELECO|nr:hypothetical protein PR202_gb19724 [Eleusine coracana subsp. coracana]
MDLLKKLSSALGFTEKIGGAVVDMLLSTGARLWNVEEEAEKLRRMEKRIRARCSPTPSSSAASSDDDFVKLWLQELRAAAFDVDALLDRLGTMAAVSRVAAAEPSRKRKRLWPNVDLGLRQRWELDAWIVQINERPRRDRQEQEKAATKMIIEAVTGKKCKHLSLDILQEQLRDHLRKKQFMLVIDNVWAKGFQFWEFLKPSLTVGEEGSKVLITTQDERVSKMMSNILNIAFRGSGIDWAEDCHKLPRFPISSKVTWDAFVSDANGQKEQWEIILSDMQFLEDDRNTDIILASLQISYQHLSYQLKQCFAFCSMYPFGFEFEKEELLRLWMADGLVKSNGRRRVEMEANRFFDELLWRSFFETSQTFPNQKFRVPNLMLDVARRVSRYESLTLDPESSQVTEHPEFRQHFFSKLTYLRALDLSYTALDALPDSIGCSVHLRYLSLRNTLIKALPETVCNLFNLQTLDLNDCYWLMDLPEGLNRLVNLRHLCLHLDWDRVTPFRSMPSGIDKLQSLQTLSRFVVTSRDGGKCNINELKNLKIRGELCILNLEAASSDGATEANMLGKEYLQKLMLKWSEVCKDEQQQHMEDSERKIEALCPHTNLKHLRIENYPGRKLPSWVDKIKFSGFPGDNFLP